MGLLSPTSPTRASRSPRSLGSRSCGRAALEQRIDADLALGRHAELVGELEALLREHPLRERLRAQLMLALYRCGRQAEALEAYQEGRRVLIEELGIEPSPELQELHRDILNQDASLAVASAQKPALKSRPTLPAATNRLIGRREELKALSDLLLGEARLVTLTGAGGSGKTRLALEVATSLAAEFGQEVNFVLLAPMRQPELLPTRIMAALGIKEAAGERPLETLKHSLQGQALLLVLDNFEHLLESAPLLAELLADCPRLKLLVTSRAALHLSGEHEYPLEPLPLKQALALFTERAQRRQARFRRRRSRAGGDLRSSRLSAARPRARRSPEQAAFLPGTAQPARAQLGATEGRAARSRFAPADAACDDRLEPRPARS